MPSPESAIVTRARSPSRSRVTRTSPCSGVNFSAFDRRFRNTCCSRRESALGLTGALGTVAESVDGIFTGRLVGEILHGPGKAHAVRSLAIREGLNLKRCTAYSDSYNDVPLLSLVGTAVAINPDAALRDLARKRGWEIRDFRTARKAARIGVPSALALGAAGGALAAVASRRQSR